MIGSGIDRSHVRIRSGTQADPDRQRSSSMQGNLRANRWYRTDMSWTSCHAQVLQPAPDLPHGLPSRWNRARTRLALRHAATCGATRPIRRYRLLLLNGTYGTAPTSSTAVRISFERYALSADTSRTSNRPDRRREERGEHRRVDRRPASAASLPANSAPYGGTAPQTLRSTTRLASPCFLISEAPFLSLCATPRWTNREISPVPGSASRRGDRQAASLACAEIVRFGLLGSSPRPRAGSGQRAKRCGLGLASPSPDRTDPRGASGRR